MLKAKAKPITGKFTEQGFRNEFRKLFGKESFYTDPKGNVIKIDNALLEHLIKNKSLNRIRFLSFLPETLETPQEIWEEWYKDKDTGKLKIRRRYIKHLSYEENSKEKHIVGVVDKDNGNFSGVTIIPYGKRGTKNTQKVRHGKLIYKG